MLRIALDQIKVIKTKLALLGKRQGRTTQAQRWLMRKQLLRLEGVQSSRHKPATKKGDSKGAFGRPRFTIDPRPALRPKAMMGLRIRQQALRAAREGGGC